MDIGFPHTVLTLNKAQRFDLFHDVIGHLGKGKNFNPVLAIKCLMIFY